MSGFDLDAMRGRWAAANRDVEATLALDVAAVRTALHARQKRAFRRHSGWLLVRLLGGGVAAAALLAFMATHGRDLRYLLLSAPLLVLVLSEWVVDGREWRALSRMDFDRPVLSVRSELNALRTRRLAMSKWIFLTSFFLWLPMLIVLVRGLSRFDVLSVLDPDFFWINQAVSLAFIPAAMIVARWLTRRYQARPGFQHFLDDVAGRSWTQAQQALAARTNFERELDHDGAVTTLARRLPAAAPAALRVPLAALKRRLALATVVFAVLMLATGLFNGLHGGQLHALVPGIALHLFWIVNLVAAILHVTLIAKTDFALPADELVTRMTGTVMVRARMARWVLVLSPVAALMGVQVSALAFTGTDLLAVLPWPWLLGGAVFFAIAAQVVTRLPLSPGVLRVLDVLSLGALARTRALAEAITRLAA
jgi:hypothetical protein